MLIVDAHQDLAWNMLTFNRDYTLSAAEIRRAENGKPASQYNDDTLLGWPEYQRGWIAVIFATVFATPKRFQLGDWDKLCYLDASQANQLYRAQLEVYERVVDEHADKFRLIHTQNDLQELLTNWKDNMEKDSSEEPVEHTVGLVLLMEGAECVRDPGELDEWWERGIRIIGPAWGGTRFCGGTHEPGPLTAQGFALLESMADLGFGLDLTHMDEKAALQALEIYPGQILATHSNALALLKGYGGNRHLSDRLIQGILERDGVIGVVPFNAFLKKGWRRGDRRDEVGLERLAAQIDYICQMAGDARHVGIGSDFDGGFGLQSVPIEIESIADLQKIGSLLAEKGFSTADIAAILADNWLDRLRQILPESV